jgi:eukaryotic-like serine/threonine-protein kinase
MHRGILWCPHCGAPHPLGTKICPTSAKSIERTVTKEKVLPHPLIGTKVGGKYVVQRLIGAGGAGEVFEAEHVHLHRMVALKLVGASASPQAVARLEREALLVAAVHHPNICDVYDFGTLPDGSPFIVLERLFGETLADILRRKTKLPLGSTADIFAQMLSGLQAAHGAQIVHRDLKPQNVFLADRLGCAPLVKLLDFGFAKDTSGLRTRSITKPGTVFGTIQYMSPEQLKNEPAIPQSDLFAVGIMLYEALGGVHPFSGATLGEVRANVLRGQPAPLGPLRREVTTEINDVVMKALAIRPEERYQTALDFQKALAQAFVDAGTDTPPSSLPPTSF